MILRNGLEVIHLVIGIHNSKGFRQRQVFSDLAFVTGNTLRESPLMAYHFRVGRVV